MFFCFSAFASHTRTRCLSTIVPQSRSYFYFYFYFFSRVPTTIVLNRVYVYHLSPLFFHVCFAHPRKASTIVPQSRSCFFSLFRRARSTVVSPDRVYDAVPVCFARPLEGVRCSAPGGGIQRGAVGDDRGGARHGPGQHHPDPHGGLDSHVAPTHHSVRELLPRETAIAAADIPAAGIAGAGIAVGRSAAWLDICSSS